MRRKYKRKNRRKSDLKTAFFGILILCISIVINTENQLSKSINNTVESLLGKSDIYEQTAVKVGLSFADITTSFKSPIENPVITSPYGQRINPVTQVSSFHCGIDLDTFSSQNVTSIADGQITLIDYDEINGNYVLISHSNGYESVYAHLDEITITSGDIKQGELIGTIGNTGMSTGTHLHLEIHKNGQHIDPQSVINFYEN